MKWKRHKYMLWAVLAASVFFVITAIYVYSYRLSSQQKEERLTLQREREENLVQENTSADDLILPVADDRNVYVTPRMTYVLQIYDARTSVLTEQEEKIPIALYGLDRNEVSEYLTRLSQEENKDMTDVDIRYDLISFSSDRFTVRKTISEKEPEYALFLIAESGYLTAYSGDLTSVYEYTQIPLADFPLEQQAMLTKGIFMKTLADYYDFLETYSS